MKGAEANQVKEYQDLASRSATGLVTFRYAGNPIGKIHIIFPLAPKKIWAIESQGVKFLKSWNVREPASQKIKTEMKS